MKPQILILTAALSLVACNSYKSKIHNEDTGPITASAIDYQVVHDQIFAPYCLCCHSASGGNKGDVNLETYQNVIDNLDDIKTAVLVKQAMPPKRAGGPLASNLQQLLSTWINAGAPLDAGAVTPTPTPAPIVTPTPVASPSPSVTPALDASPSPSLSPSPVVPSVSPSPSPSSSAGDQTTQPPPVATNPPTQPSPITIPGIVLPTWQDISDKIFNQKCIRCHSVGKKAEDDPLTDRDYVVDPKNQLVIAGHPEQSDLIKAITRQDSKRMPPAKTGLTLSDQEINAIQTWILNGAKD